MKRRRANSGRALTVGSAIRPALRFGRRLIRSYTKTAGRTQKARETPVLTDQRDVITTYRKRFMPRRRKRRYVRQLRRWQSNQLRLEPARFFNYVEVDNINWGANTSAYFGAFMGLFGQNNYDNNFGETWNSITNSPQADTKAEAGKFRLDHMSLRVVIRNTTTTGAAGATPVVDIDCYKVVCIRDVPLALWASGLGIESFMAGQKNKLRQAQGMDIEVTTAGSGIPSVQQNAGTSSVNQVVGDSMFNNPLFTRYFRVLKCFKIQLGSNNMTEFSWRDSKNQYIMREQCFGTSALAAKRGVTKGYIFNVNGRPYFPTATPEFISGSLICEQYVRYNVKCIAGTAPTLVYDGA